MSFQSYRISLSGKGEEGKRGEKNRSKSRGDGAAKKIAFFSFSFLLCLLLCGSYCCSANNFFSVISRTVESRSDTQGLMHTCFFLVDLLLSPDSSLSSERGKVAVVVEESMAEKD